MNRRIWTDAHTVRPRARADLRRLTAKEFAAEYGITGGHVYGIRRALKIKGRRPPRAPRTPQRSAKAVARDLAVRVLRAQGKTLREIGQQFGITRERVRQLLQRQGGSEIPGYTVPLQALAKRIGVGLERLRVACSQVKVRVYRCRVTEEGMRKLEALLEPRKQDCTICGRTFETRRPRHKICSAACRKVFQTRRNRGEFRGQSQGAYVVRMRALKEKVERDDGMVPLQDFRRVSGLSKMAVAYLRRCQAVKYELYGGGPQRPVHRYSLRNAELIAQDRQASASLQRSG